MIDVREYLMIVLVACFVQGVALGRALARRRPEWSQARVVATASVPVPTLVLVLCGGAMLFERLGPRGCAIDGCDMLLAAAPALAATALIGVPVAAAAAFAASLGRRG